MTATLRDEITMLSQTPAHIDGEHANPRTSQRRTDRSRQSRSDTTDASDSPGQIVDAAARITRLSRSSDTRRRYGAPSYLASLVDIVPVLPTVGTIATVFAYIGGPTLLSWHADQIPLVIGGTVAVTIGLVTASLHRSLFTTAERAHPRSFAEIRQRVDGLAAQLRVLESDASHDATVSQRLAIEEAGAHQRTLEHDLARGGPQWIIGTGYVDALTRLHRAEESLIMAQPADDVVAGALFDEIRIAGSTMADRDRLLGKLRAAVLSLRPSASAYLIDHDCGRPRTTGATSPKSAPAAIVPPASPSADTLHLSPPSAASTEAEARIVLREVRRALNDFRDESRARLIRSRGRLLGTMTMTGVITYVLLAFAVSLEEGRTVSLSDPIVAAAAIYLVGAVVGLFNRLHIESGDDAAGEDFGLSKTRLLLTPMLSGLAAVGGVLIVGMLSGIVDVNAVTPTRGAADILGPAATQIGTEINKARVDLSLHDIFNLRAYPFALVLAAIFGLTPKAFLKRLQRATEQSHLDLKSTTAAHLPAAGSQSNSSQADRP